MLICRKSPVTEPVTGINATVPANRPAKLKLLFICYKLFILQFFFLLYSISNTYNFPIYGKGQVGGVIEFYLELNPRKLLEFIKFTKDS